MAEVKALIDGYRKFYNKYFKSGDTLYKELAEGQSPKTLIIACSDSRADPSIITTASPGDIFVIRNVANLVPPYENDKSGLHHGVSASLEFAVAVLNVKNIIVMGHSGCAGIAALLDSDKVKDTDFIGNWVDIASAAKEKTIKENPQDCQLHCEKESILLSLDNLVTFPWIRSGIESKTLKLHGWYFSVQDGSLEEFDPKKNSFIQIPAE